MTYHTDDNIVTKKINYMAPSTNGFDGFGKSPTQSYQAYKKQSAWERDRQRREQERGYVSSNGDYWEEAGQPDLPEGVRLRTYESADRRTRQDMLEMYWDKNLWYRTQDGNETLIEFMKEEELEERIATFLHYHRQDEIHHGCMIKDWLMIFQSEKAKRENP